jgi:hypothetical protein
MTTSESLRSQDGLCIRPPGRGLWPSKRRGSPIYSACPLCRAVFLTPAVSTTSLDCSSIADAAFTQCVEVQQPLVRANSRLIRCLTRLQSSLYATARHIACPAWPGLLRTELAWPMSPPDHVGYHYAATVNSRDWSFTSWTDSLMGCTHT